jgi:hypothetical protein
MKIPQNNFIKLILIVALAVSLECLIVAFAGSQMRQYAHKLELSEMPDYIGRTPDDLSMYYVVYFFMWLLSQGLATLIGVTISYDKLNFQNQVRKSVFIILTLMAILIIKWNFQPWFISLSELTRSASQVQTDHFRRIIIPGNILIAAICILIIRIRNMRSIRKRNAKENQ